MHLLALATRKGQPREWDEVTVVLADDAGIEAVNRLHLSRRGATDVISFNYLPLPGDSKGHCGEIIVNVQCAVERTSSGKSWDASKELALYIAHGFDHLTGGRDATSRQRAQMRRAELVWLKEAESFGLVKGLVAVPLRA